MRYSITVYGIQERGKDYFYEDYEDALKAYNHYKSLGYRTTLNDERTDEVIKR